MYTTSKGDTFSLISRKVYGTENDASRIASANPGAAEPLAEGTQLVIPEKQDEPKNKTQKAVAAGNEEVALLIDGKRFRFWDKIRITRSIDAMDTVDFSAPFDSNLPDFKTTFRPFSFKPMEVTVGGEHLFTGTLIAINPVIEEAKKSISVSGYSKPGVLNDCTPPASAKVEFENCKLKTIATSICSPFGIDVVFLADQGAKFELAACDLGKKALEFLIDLAKQRNLVLSSSASGQLIFWQSVKPGSPVAKLRQGESPLVAVTPTFSPQECYSHITGIESADIGLDGSQFTVKNTNLTTVLRPTIFTTGDAGKASVKSCVQAKAGRMYGNMASYSVSVATWRDPSGKMWEPNTTISLIAPDAMIYKEYEFIIRDAAFEREANSSTATLTLVMPGAFSGEIPEELPWDE